MSYLLNDVIFHRLQEQREEERRLGGFTYNKPEVSILDIAS